ncbi:MAG: hypothetical protein HWN66_10760 [Candidatus Helarchaeota archaeon]|nr:hypothetical protein [Candidatus Helarchaeota archaeon]
MSNEKAIVDELYKLVDEGANPREAREAINEKFPDWNDRTKLQRILPKVENMFPAIRKTYIRKTSYFKLFLIGADNIRARGKKLTEI